MFLKILGFFLLNSISLIITLGIIAIIIAGIIYSIFSKKDRHISLKQAKKILIKSGALSDDNEGNLKEGLSFFDFKEVIKNLENEKNIEEIIIDIDNCNFSLTQIEELEPIFKKLSNSKKVIAIGSNFDKKGYFTALLADKIYILSSFNASVNISGYNRTYFYYKKLLDKLGIKVNVLHIGDYKAAGENYSRENMSEENKRSLINIYDNIEKYFIEKVKEKRNIDITELIQNGELVEQNYIKIKELGLVDDYYWDNYSLDIDKDDNTLEILDYYKLYKPKKNKSKNTIAVINLEGVIRSNSTKGISYETVLASLNQLDDIDDLKGIVLRVNSPGGSALESEKILRLLKNIDVPIFVSMGEVCASGGYYISTVSRKLYANQNTITGSIGVVSIYPTFQDTLNHLKINTEILSTGEASELFNVFEPLGDKARLSLINHMKNVYLEFKKHVMSARIISDENLENIAGGRVWLGKQALENRLIDKIGGLDDAIKGLANYLKLEDYKVENIQKKVSLKEKIQSLKPTLISEKLENELNFINEMKEIALYYEDFKL